MTIKITYGERSGFSLPSPILYNIVVTFIVENNYITEAGQQPHRDSWYYSVSFVHAWNILFLKALK